MGNTHAIHYKKLVIAFAASAFVLLSMLSVQQYESNTQTAAVVRRSTVLTNYRHNCLTRVRANQRGTARNYHLCATR